MIQKIIRMLRTQATLEMTAEGVAYVSTFIGWLSAAASISSPATSFSWGILSSSVASFWASISFNLLSSTSFVSNSSWRMATCEQVSEMLFYSLRVDNTCCFGKWHGLKKKTTLIIIFHYNMYKSVNKYMILLKYFLRLIYTCSHHIWKTNILKMIYNQRL